MTAPVTPPPDSITSILPASLTSLAVALDDSPLNRSNIKFSRLSMAIAKRLIESEVEMRSEGVKGFDSLYSELAEMWNTRGMSGQQQQAPPAWCCVEGVKYAIGARKISSIPFESLVIVVVPFFKEFERGEPSTDSNPNGELASVQKVEELMFLLSFNEKITVDLIFVNDSVSEKKDEKDGGSGKVFKKQIIDYLKARTIGDERVSELGEVGEVGEITNIVTKHPVGATRLEQLSDEFDSLSLMSGRLNIKFTSIEQEAQRQSKCEWAEEKRKRYENRGEDGKLRERKGAAVLAGMEMDVREEWKGKEDKVVRCFIDGDCAHPVGSFVGDAAYSIIQQGHSAYLGNLKSRHTCISVVGEESGGGSQQTQFRVANRKLFFSGFIVPLLFPELNKKYKYTGTTQLPIKAFRGDVDFTEAKLPTVQPNVDLGLLAVLISHLDSHGGTIDSGAVTVRDNISSSTMTSSDLTSEWVNTYCPIFTTAVGLSQKINKSHFTHLPEWVCKMISDMREPDYLLLFGESAANDDRVIDLFEEMKSFRSSDDQLAVLEKLKKSFQTIGMTP
eukprot:GHVN01023561.1.p1 GENE.GHVN01023561.1~~GHVN01023561.1.p1  ORF type:complete len:583 (+),score=157.46 GHVN01023561.1:72-1751(+)